MKTLTLILVLVVTAGSAQAQTVDEVRQQMIERTPNLQLSSDWKPADALEREAAQDRRNGGIALTVIGIGLEMAAGALMGYAWGQHFGDDIGNAFGANPPLSHDTRAYEYGAAGCAASGLIAIVAGIDLWVTGQKRLNRLNVTPTLGGASATIVF